MAQTVIPTVWEAEAGGSLEVRSSRQQSSEIVPLHSSLGDTARHCIKKEERVRMKYRRPLRTSLSTTCPVIKANGKLQQPIQAGLQMTQTLQE